MGMKTSTARESRAGGREAKAGSVELQVDLTDAAAEAWLTHRGWSAVEWRSPFRLRADVIATPEFQVARIWHTAARLRRMSVLPQDRTRFVFTLILDGEMRFETSAGAHGLDRADAFIADRSEALNLVTEAPSARIVVSSRWDRLGLHRVPSLPTPGLVSSDGGYRKVLISAVHALLAAEIEPAQRGFPSIRRAIEAHIASILLQDAADVGVTGTTSASSLREAGLAIIAAEVVDPDFTVARLAQALHVSRTYLHHVFAAADTTPSEQIREARTRSARALLAAVDATTDEELLLIARESGYRTTRAMRYALNKHSR